MIYFAKCAKDGLTKIGYTMDVAHRLQQLRYSYGGMTLLFAMEGGFDEEQAIHRQLRCYQVGGEWFRLPIEVISVLKDRYKKEDKFTEDEGLPPIKKTIKVPRQTYEWLHKWARDHKMTMQDLWDEIIGEYLWKECGFEHKPLNYLIYEDCKYRAHK